MSTCRPTDSVGSPAFIHGSGRAAEEKGRRGARADPPDPWGMTPLSVSSPSAPLLSSGQEGLCNTLGSDSL